MPKQKQAYPRRQFRLLRPFPFPISRCSTMQEIGRRVHTRVRKYKTPAREVRVRSERGSSYRFIISDTHTHTQEGGREREKGERDAPEI